MTITFANAILNNLPVKQKNRLDNFIVQRFTPDYPNQTLRFIGVVDWVHCSPLGFFIAKLIQPLAILPAICARKIQFSFQIKPGEENLLKQRCYHFFRHRVPFTFSSTFKEDPFLHEEFKAGLGMRLKLKVKGKNLLFIDNGYFFRFASWRLPIPRLLSVGRFELIHRSIDMNRFQILIRLAHPLLGTLFYQRGEFTRI